MFEWDNSFSVNIDLIDNQHKNLFSIGEQIYILLYRERDDSDIQDIMNLIDELYKYTKYHFQEEERIMKFYNYPELGVHINEHKKFIEYIDSLKISEMIHNKNDSLNDLIKFIDIWITKHIKNVDVRYSKYIGEKW